MIKRVIYKEGDLEIDIGGEEELKKRADISVGNYPKGKYDNSLEGFKGHWAGLGGMEHGEEEATIKTDLKRTGWKEARKATDVKHTCLVCGTRYWGRPNKKYCGTPCKEVAKKRRQRKRKRDIRDFKPHAGTVGQIFYMIKVKGRDVISFIPANFADTRIKAKGYIDERYEKEDAEEIMEQVKEVLKK